MKLNLPRQTILLVLSILFLIASSCRSRRELTYYSDANGHERISGTAKPMPIYRIHKKDNLYISIISDNPDLNKVYNPVEAGTSTFQNNLYENQATQYVNGYEVNAEGNIELPIMGAINVEGKSIAECEKEIQKQSLNYLKNATVKVKLLSFRVTVLGEVKLPGVYYNYNNNFSVTDAIASANGNTDYADISQVMVVRPTESGSQIFLINLNNKAALFSDAYYLQPNDQVILQPARNKNTQLALSTAAVIFSAISAVVLILNYTKNN
jgi:polysaccharide export outer membrane protein